MNDGSTCLIPLGGRGGIKRFATVDAEDYEALMAFNWCRHNAGYACRNTKNPPRKIVLMHRVITEAPDGMEVDHINGDRLDNRRCNLRVCTKQQNVLNQGKRSTNTSGYKGVTWRESKQRWVAQISIRRDGKSATQYLGLFTDPAEASEVYKAAALRIRGEFARLT